MIHSFLSFISSFTNIQIVSLASVKERVLLYPIIGLISSVYALIPIILYKIFLSPYLFSSSHVFLLALLYLCITIYISNASMWQDLIHVTKFRAESKKTGRENLQAILFLLPLLTVLFYIGGVAQMLQFDLIEVLFFTPIFSRGSLAIVKYTSTSNSIKHKRNSYHFIEVCLVCVSIATLGYYILPLIYLLNILIAFLVSFTCIRILSKHNRVLDNSLYGVHILITEILIFIFIAL